MAESGHCIVCGKPIPEKEDGTGSYMIADLKLNHPIYPSLQTHWSGRWVCQKCYRDIANNVCENDALF